MNDRILTLSDASRRRLLTAGALGGASLVLPGALRQAFAQAPITVGAIYVGPRDDFGYNQAHAEAAAQLEEDGRRQGAGRGERARDAGRAEDACRA
jgi:basic membrane lipoprotein Med (substrate-binding protein (PBP1-ABC) superfamily)